MKLIHDYLLVKEVIPEKTIGNTGLKTKYDDSDRFMIVEIVEKSEMLVNEYFKYFFYGQRPEASDLYQLRKMIEKLFTQGTKLLINRVAKTPYKEGMYIISFKDIVAVLQDDEI